MAKLTRVQRRKRMKSFFTFVLLTILLFFIVIFSLKSSFFNIHDFLVKGNKKITVEEIIKTSMINKGDNIFKINKKNSIHSIEDIPYIKSVNIRRKFPKNIEIKIVERKPLLYIQKSSNFLVIDEEGFVLEKKDENKEEKPILMGLNIKNIELGENLFSIYGSNGIIEFVQETISLKLLNKFNRVDFKTKDNIVIELKDGVVVAFGEMDNIVYKLRLLDEVLKDSNSKNIKYTKIIMNKGVNPILVTED